MFIKTVFLFTLAPFLLVGQDVQYDKINKIGTDAHFSIPKVSSDDQKPEVKDVNFNSDDIDRLKTPKPPGANDAIHMEGVKASNE